MAVSYTHLVAVGQGLKKGVQNTAFNAEIGIRKDSHLRGDLIRHLKSHAGYVVRHAVRIFFYYSIQRRAIFLIDFHRQIHGNAILLKDCLLYTSRCV